MYKVLIADDERLIRITLKNMLNWEALNCEVIATAKDGKEAYHIFEQVHPEIVITDLKMPAMDGIELIKKIKAQSENTQIIVLSNYSDFELVRDAMKAGAFDYLLKITLEKEDLARVLKQAKENCVEGYDDRKERDVRGVKELQQCMILSKNEHIIHPQEYANALSMPAFKAFVHTYQVAYFRVDNIHVLYEGKFKEHEHLMHHLSDLIKESISTYLTYHVIFISNHSGIILFNSDEKMRVMTICNSIIRNIEQYMNVKVSIALSDIHHDLNVFYEVYMNTIVMHDQRFYLGEGSLIQGEAKHQFKSLDMNDVHFHTEFAEAIAKKDFHHVDELIATLLYYMRDHDIEPEQVIEYTVFIINNLEGKEMEKGARYDMPFDKLIARIRKCETMDKLKVVLKEGAALIEGWLKDDTNSRYRREITEIMDFVERNYDKKINLKILSETLDMNESTLSRLFKSETGMNLNYYINSKRMDKAKSLLLNPNYRIKDVASAVGMDDQLYFNKVFKKYYNLSPSDYRKHYRNQND